MQTIKVKNGHCRKTPYQFSSDYVSFTLKNLIKDKEGHVIEYIYVTKVYYRCMEYRVISTIVDDEDISEYVRIFEDSDAMYKKYYVGYGTNLQDITELIIFDNFKDALNYIG